MAANNTDVKLIFGVDNGASMSQDKSGGIIKKELQAIVTEINKNPFRIKFTVDEQSLRNIRNQIQSIMGSAVRFTINQGNGGGGNNGGGDDDSNVMREGTVEYNNALTRTIRLLTQLELMQGRYRSVQSSTNQTVREAYNALGGGDGLIQQLRNLRDAITGDGVSAEQFALNITEISTSAAAATESLKTFTQANGNILNAATNTEEWHLAITRVNSAIRSVESDLLKTSEVAGTDTLRRQLQGTLDQLNTLRLRLLGGNQGTSGQTMGLLNFNDELTSLTGRAKILSDEIKKLGISPSIQEGTKQYYDTWVKIDKEIANINALKTKYDGVDGAGAFDEQISSLEELQGQLGKGLTTEEVDRALAKIKKESRETSAALDSTSSSLQNVDNTITASFGTQFGNALFDQVKNLQTSLTSRLIGFAGVMRGVRVVKDMINTSNELESAMAELQMVTRGTDAEYQRFGADVAKTAQEISTSIDDLISATTTYSRLGYSLDESSILAKYTGMLERVGNIDTKAAEDSITSILKAFSNEVDVEDAESVMDRLVVVGNNFPISVEQIAAGMTNASSSLAAAGNSFNESVALLVAANTTIQDANKASTGLRTLTARLRNTKAELDELGEEMTSAKYEGIVQMLTKHQVSLMDLNGEYRSTYDIMKDIAGLWNDLSSMEQAAMATEIAGVRQQAVFYSLMDQFSEAENAMNAMENSAGELTDAYAIYQETTQAHLETLGAAWDKLSQDVVNSRMNQTLIDIATNFVNFLDKLAQAKVLLPTVLAAFTAFKSLGIVNTMMQLSHNTNSLAAGMVKAGAGSIVYKGSVDRLTESEKRYLVVQLQKARAMKQIEQGTYDQIIANYGLAGSEKAVEAGTNGVSVAVQSLFLSNPLGMILSIVSAVIALGSAISAMSATTRRSIDDIKADIDSLNSKMADTAAELNKINEVDPEAISRFAELRQGVNRFGDNLTLTNDEYDEFVTLSKELKEVLPDLDIRNLSSDVDTLTQSLRDLLDQARQEKLGDLSRGRHEALALAQEETSAYDHEIKMLERDLKYVSQKKLELLNAKADLDALQDATNKAIASGALPATAEDAMMSDARAKYAKIDKEYQDMVSRLGSISSLNDKIEELRGEKDHAYDSVAESYSAWIQTNSRFIESKEFTQKLMLDMLKDIDYSQFKDDGEVTSYIRENILDAFADIPEEAQKSMQAVYELNKVFASGASSVGLMRSGYEELRGELEASNVSSDNIAKIMELLGANDIENKAKAVANGLGDDADAAERFVNSLSSSELDRAFSLIETNGKMSIDDMKEALDEATESADNLAGAIERALDVTELFEKLGKISKNVDKITSAMKKLRDGTALTKSELVKIAEEYPELLKQSDLFTDGSIAGQQKLLQVILDCLETEYDAHLETKIAEQKTALESIKAQIQAVFDAAKISISVSEFIANPAKLWSDPEGAQNDLQFKIAHFGQFTSYLNTIQNLQNEIDNLTAMKGLSLDELYPGSSSSSSSNSSGGSSSSSDSWFKRAYEEHKHWISMDKETTAQFLKWLAQAYKDAYSQGVITQSEYYKYEEEVYKGVQDLAKNAQSALDSVLQYYIKTLKEQNTAQKESLNNRLNALKEFYDKQKQMLQDQYDEDKYLEEQGEKRKTITALMAQLEQLQYDNSAYAEKRRLEIQQELADAQKELADFEKSHALEAMQNELDDIYERQAADIKSEIEQIEDVINDPTALYNQALNDIKNNTAALYQAIIAYGEANRTGMTNDAKKAWDEAVAALLAYKDYYGTSYNGVVLSGYSGGTRSATRGWHAIDENGSETVFESAGGERFRMFAGGEMVLDAKSSEFLYQFAKSKGTVMGDMNHIGTGFGQTIVNAGDIIINGDTNEKTVSEIRRAQRQSLENLLREFSRLNK